MYSDKVYPFHGVRNTLREGLVAFAVHGVLKSENASKEAEILIWIAIFEGVRRVLMMVLVSKATSLSSWTHFANGSNSRYDLNFLDVFVGLFDGET